MIIQHTVRHGFWPDRRGATAIEFAILAPIFIFLMLAIVDFGLLYYANSRVERGVFLAEKKLSEGWKPENFEALKAMLCAEADINCQSEGLKIEVVPLTATSPLPSTAAIDKLNLVPGQAHVIRVVYPWSGIFPRNLFSTIGFDEIMTKSINVGMFFHVKS